MRTTKLRKKGRWRYYAFAAQRLYLDSKPKEALKFLEKIYLPYQRVDLMFIKVMTYLKTDQIRDAYIEF